MILRLGIVLAVVLLAWASARFFTRRDGTVVSSQDRLSPPALASLNLPVVDVPYRAVL
ncbi:MAG: hypothetical protein ACI867_001668, partial [Glaciecola sp.]